MGIDYDAKAAFGVKLTYEEASKFIDVFEDLEEMFYDMRPAEYIDFLTVVVTGSRYGGDVDYIIAVIVHEASYDAKEFNPLDYDSRALGWLEKFCKAYNIDFKPKWYVGLLQS